MSFGGFSNPSKMPWLAYGISAEACQTGGKLRQVEGSVCSICYAHKGMYMMPNTKAAHERRMVALQQALRDPAARDQWVNSMADELNGKASRRRKPGKPVFRWFDSGDLQSVSHFEMICAVATLTPNVNHYMPTKERGMVRNALRKGVVIPDNMVVRISAPMLDGDLVKGMGHRRVLHAVSYTDADTLQARLGSDNPCFWCPAYKQDGECGECRACWSDDVRVIAYPAH